VGGGSSGMEMVLEAKTDLLFGSKVCGNQGDQRDHAKPGRSAHRDGGNLVLHEQNKDKIAVASSPRPSSRWGGYYPMRFPVCQVIFLSLAVEKQLH